VPRRPDLLVLGQVTVDHVVPAAPGPWRELLGGNALYAAAGARLWSDPQGIGVVTRLGRGLPVDVAGLLESAGLSADGLARVDAEHLVEWMLYEDDGSRRSLPRNPALRDAAADEAALRKRYLAWLEALSPTAEDVPPAWLPARAAHLAPQVAVRHRASVARLRGQVAFLSVDPSPHYARELDEPGLARLLAGARALLPSRAEVERLGGTGDWPALVARLRAAGFPEVVLKLGAEGCLVAGPGAGPPERIPAVRARVVDPTGAGDAFCGAYAATRALGLDPLEAGRRAVVAAAMVVECAGAAAALALSPAAAHDRLAAGAGRPRSAAG
jgi:sugar/nucleoside kinase (ribokinase family)